MLVPLEPDGVALLVPDPPPTVKSTTDTLSNGAINHCIHRKGQPKKFTLDTHTHAKIMV